MEKKLLWDDIITGVTKVATIYQAHVFKRSCWVIHGNFDQADPLLVSPLHVVIDCPLLSCPVIEIHHKLKATSSKINNFSDQTEKLKTARQPKEQMIPGQIWLTLGA